MIDGIATIARVDGLGDEITNIPGRVRIAIARREPETQARLDIHRNTSDEKAVMLYWEARILVEFPPSSFALLIWNHILNEAAAPEDLGGELTRYQLRLRRDAGLVSTFNLWLEMENGQLLKATLCAIKKIQVIANVRRVVMADIGLIILGLEEVESLEDATLDTTIHVPVGGLQARFYINQNVLLAEDGTPILTEDGSEILSGEEIGPADEVATYQTTFTFERELTPCRFGRDGRATRYRQGHQGNITGEIELDIPTAAAANALLTNEAQKDLAIKIEGLRNGGEVMEFYFPRCRCWLPGQEFLDERQVNHTMAFHARQQSDGVMRAVIVLSEALLAAPFDFAVIRYMWDEAGGTDLDTRTAIILTGDVAIDGQDLGWNRNATVPVTSILPGCSPSGIGDVSGFFAVHGGDNCEQGVESILIDFAALTAAYPDAESFTIRLRAFWYSIRSSGDITLQFQTYLGGTMAQDGYDFANTGGGTIQEIDVAKNVVTNDSADIDGDDLGTLVYIPATQTATLLPP